MRYVDASEYDVSPDECQMVDDMYDVRCIGCTNTKTIRNDRTYVYVYTSFYYKTFYRIRTSVDFKEFVRRSDTRYPFGSVRYSGISGDRQYISLSRFCTLPFDHALSYWSILCTCAISVVNQ